mgnify:CR=1 FL=1
MNPTPTWQSTLGNSPHIVAAGAVGQAMQQEIDSLRTRVAELEKDAGRYRWLCDNRIVQRCASSDGPAYKELSFTGIFKEGRYFKIENIGLDAAIDAAMKGAQA